MENKEKNLDSLTQELSRPKDPAKRKTLKQLLTLIGAVGVTSPSALLNSCASVKLGSSAEITDHFRIYGAPRGYGKEAEKALEDLTGFLGHPYYGVIEISVGGATPFTTRGIPPKIEMPSDRIYSDRDPLVAELVRAITITFDPLLNRGLAVVSQRTLRPNKRTFPLFGHDLYLSVPSEGTPSNLLYHIGNFKQYIIDGSFVGYLIKEYGIERLMDLTSMAYGSGNRWTTFPKADVIVYGKTLDQLVGEWREKIQENPNRKPFDLKFKPQWKSYDEEMIRRHKGRVIVIGNENFSKSGLRHIEHDAIETYDFLSRFFQRGFFPEEKFRLDLTRLDPQFIRWTWGGNFEMQVPPNHSLGGNYSLVILMAYPFIGTAGNLPSKAAAVYLNTLKPELGSLKTRASPNMGIDIDKLARAYIDDFIPLDRVPYSGDEWKEQFLQFIQAGSFGRWVVNSYAKGDAKKGVEILSRVAHGYTYESVFGASLATMERGWIEHLRKNVRL